MLYNKAPVSKNTRLLSNILLLNNWKTISQPTEAEYLRFQLLHLSAPTIQLPFQHFQRFPYFSFLERKLVFFVLISTTISGFDGVFNPLCLLFIVYLIKKVCVNQNMSILRSIYVFNQSFFVLTHLLALCTRFYRIKSTIKMQSFRPLFPATTS